jgi:hypothetical protein
MLAGQPQLRLAALKLPALRQGLLTLQSDLVVSTEWTSRRVLLCVADHVMLHAVLLPAGLRLEQCLQLLEGWVLLVVWHVLLVHQVFAAAPESCDGGLLQQLLHWQLLLKHLLLLLLLLLLPLLLLLLLAHLLLLLLHLKLAVAAAGAATAPFLLQHTRM